MKAKITLTTIFIFIGTILFAANFKTLLFYSLAPVTPTEATFEDADGWETMMVSVNMLRFLAPSTPKEATFEDEANAEVISLDLSALAPATPIEADFNDTEVSDSTTHILHPTTPKEADFEDFI